MATKTITWLDGSTAVLTYSGQGSGPITVQSDANNNYEARSVQVTVKTTDGSNIQRIVTIQQAAKVRTDISNAVVTAANQTYSGTAKTPTPTVTLNGVTIPSSGYDVAYSNNTNAGTATITITGKGDYTGTATGTFTIAKASRTLSFADAYAVVAPSGNITKTATPSAGSGDGAITYTISSTTYATINSSSGKVTAKTSEGSAIVTATIAEGTNYLGATASYNLYVFATTHNFDYTGSVQNITLPPGSYKLQCWGAQGGSNAAASTYGITAQAGGKGGYSEGVFTIAEQLALQVVVGGQGSSSAGGFNGGGSTSGASTKNADNEQGVSRMGGGGGATDIRLSSGTLLSRMIVAGGGSGGCMSYKKVTSTTTEWQSVGTINPLDSEGTVNGHTWTKSNFKSGSNYYVREHFVAGEDVFASGDVIRITWSTSFANSLVYWSDGTNSIGVLPSNTSNPAQFTYVVCPGPDYYLRIQTRTTSAYYSGTILVEKQVTVPTTTTETLSQVGYVGGGEHGGGSDSNAWGSQTAAGDGGSFGEGAPVNLTRTRYCSGAGGGGWYGGGRTTSNVSINNIKRSGGGSGFVNIAANAQYSPSGYTGIDLDSGSTYAGDTSFPSTGSGTETGHSGNGYARITRL